MTITKSEQDGLNKKLWDMCNSFRGKIDSSEYKDYILTMLFIKYISDVWNGHLEEYRERFGNDDERIKRKLKRERFIIPDGCTFYDIYDKRDSTDVGEEINKAMMAIEDENKEKLENVFRNIDFNSEAKLGNTKERNKLLKDFLNDFIDVDLDSFISEDHDVIGNSYEYLISKFASDSGKKGGEFYTPREVSQLLAILLEPRSNEKVCDPTCGSGSLLIRTANKVKDGNVSLYGQEMNGSTWALCKMNMFLHDMDSARIERGDTINNPLLIKNNNLLKFDIVVANPPFSLKKWGHDEVAGDKDEYGRFHRGDPPRSRGDYAFLTHMIETINEHGRIGVVVPHGVLFRGGGEGKIRTKLLDDNLLDTVVGLPSNLFFGTGIPAAIMIFKKNKEHDDVLFIDASREFEKGKKQNKLLEKHLNKIYETYKNREFVDKYAYVAKLEEIQEHDYNLNIPRYVDTFVPEQEVDIIAVQKEIDDIEIELVGVRKEMDAYLKELTL